MSKIASTQIVPLKNVFVKPNEQSKFTCTLPWRENGGIYTNIILRPWPTCATTVCVTVGSCTFRMATSLRPKEPLPAC